MRTHGHNSNKIEEKSKNGTSKIEFIIPVNFHSRCDGLIGDLVSWIIGLPSNESVCRNSLDSLFSLRCAMVRFYWNTLADSANSPVSHDVYLSPFRSENVYNSLKIGQCSAASIMLFSFYQICFMFKTFYYTSNDVQHILKVTQRRWGYKRLVKGNSWCDNVDALTNIPLRFSFKVFDLWLDKS